MSEVELVVVAVPARNEAGRLDRCLTSVDAAAREWGGPVTILVGADACTDTTAAVVGRLRVAGLPVRAVEGSWRRPARVRRALVAEARLAIGAIASDRVWIASTDADCVVPRHWIVDQVRLAASGADVVLGEVALDPADTPPGLAGLFDERYADLRNRRRHVHAANLGIRLSAYDAVGGWRSSTSIGEEHHLVRCAGDVGADIRCSEDITVMTSGRTSGRVNGGFASVLRRLAVPSDVAG